MFVLTTVAHFLCDTTKLYNLTQITRQISCVNMETLPCSHAHLEAAGRCGSAAAPCANMCVLPPADTATRITACGLRILYHFRLNYDLEFSRVGSSAFFWIRVGGTRAVHLVLHCAYSTCTQRHFPQASPVPIGRLAGPMRGRVTHSVACVRACVRARGTLERLRAVCETKTRALRMGLEGSADRSQPHDSW